MSRRFTLLAVALPVLAVVIGIVRAEWVFRHGRDFVFEIGGHDPRDLLRGHYLLFRLRVDPLAVREACDDDPAEACCLCLTRGEGNRVATAERATCATARADCEGALQLTDAIRSVRYYVPEAHATDLERRLP
jgi:GDYXXLXY protein